ncbi:MAG: carboxypeptidase-like regulatory domain-containing protein [Gemmatimonadetes bacterium]|nr:carboxypeptidase-like regulatory domain-containing protein [Gemmatimonadota bacterium]
MRFPLRAMPAVFVVSAMATFGAAPGVHAQAAARSAVVTGTILADSTERPIEGAEIVLGENAARARSDSAGIFTLAAVAPGTYRLVVRAFGYHPFNTTVTLGAGQRFEADLLLTRAPQQLGTVDVSTDAITRARWRDDFNERRRLGIGHFIDEDVLSKAEGKSWASNIVGRVPGIRIIMYNGRQSFASTRGVISFGNSPGGDSFDKMQGAPIACYVAIVIDDLVRYGSAVGEPLLDITQIEPGSIAAAEYYTPSTVPTRFNRGGNAPCGTLVLWRRRN